MEIIYYEFNKKYDFPNLAVTIGAFDGIHNGHLKLIQTLLAVDKCLKKAVITFKTHPDYALNKRENYGVLNTLEEKKIIFDNLGIDYLIVLECSKELLSLDYKQFNNLLYTLNVKIVVSGKDFHYGYKGIGSYKTLKECFDTIIVDTIKYKGKKLSSTELRTFLQKGNIEELNQLMEEPFFITGQVVKGSQIGSTLGFPTANLDLNEKYSDIRLGVYACLVKYQDKIYKGVCNIGNNPTINTIIKPRLEIHIIDFNENIYEKTITIYLKKFLRDETKFTSQEELIEAIKKDKKETGKL